jgi:membrane associated rhomboid family serine protease
LNFRRLIQPMGIRFFLFMLVVFELFQLTAYLPPSMYWPSHIIAIGIGLLFWRFLLYLAKVDQ